MPKTKRLSVRVSADLHERIKVFYCEPGEISFIVTRLIKRHIEDLEMLIVEKDISPQEAVMIRDRSTVTSDVIT